MLPDSDPHSMAFWSPDDVFSQRVKGSWNGKHVEQTVFLLGNPDVRTALLHVWGGCNLPTTREVYARQLNIDLSGVPDIAGQVDALVEVYKEVDENNKAFRDRTIQSLVDLAGDIFNFTKKAGGTAASSYYGALIKALADYNTAKKKSPPDTATMDKEKEAIVAFSQDLLKRTTGLLDNCQSLQMAVDKFSSVTYDKWAALNARLEDIRRRLDPLDVKHLGGVIKDLQKTSWDQRVEYTNDVVSSGQSFLYALCPLFGVLPATPKSQYGPRASGIANVIKQIQAEFQSDDKKLNAGLVVGTDAQQITEYTDAAIVQIKATSDALKTLHAGWSRIKTNLQYLHDVAKEDKVPDVELDKDFILQRIEAWNRFGGTVDAFRQSAYISEPEAMTVDKWAEKMSL
ncbi:hypothetical protein IFM46972_06338 [Aspergillus udagawae]|uniref:Uncharacterized protein n=1 Tax=Aspergillus udagawae TaxID=91492 RepID=A0A8H3P361_9EURO|nr:hypothetical protein IFM46972_06338 [Aspergillus udagawae]